MKGHKALRSHRGFTLAELVVVMAVMGIMVMMVVSFTSLYHAWSSWGTNRYNLTKTERLSEQFLRCFISVYDSTDYYFEVDPADKGKLVAVSVADPAKRYVLSYNGEGELEYQRTEGEDAYCPVDYIKSLQFSVYTNAKRQQLINMHLTYEMPDLGVGKADNLGTYDVVVCARSEGGAA